MTSIKDVTAATLHVATDDLPWGTTAPGFETRMIHCNLEEGFSVNQIRVQPGVEQGWHRHEAPIFAYTTAGAWGHNRKYEYRPGTYVFETPGVVHRFLNGPEVTEAFFISTGHADAQFLDMTSGDVIRTVTQADLLEFYLHACEELGIPRPNVLR